MSSLWSQTAVIPSRPSLEEAITAQAAVIGGGLAGVLIAHALQSQGLQTVLLEAQTLGSGQTKNTTAKITTQHGLCYAKLIKDFGPEKAVGYARANLRAIEEYRRIICERGIDCLLENEPAFLYSTVDLQALEEEARAARQLGIDARLTADTTLPFSVKGALRFEKQAQFHPLRFLASIAEDLTVYEHTQAIRVEGDAITTDRGTVRAEHIIFATHFPFQNMPGYYFLRMHQERSYVLALEGAGALGGMYLGIDSDGLSLRNSGNHLLLGGGGHRTGENSEGGKYDQLRQAAKTYWPQAKEVAHWSAQDCVPYIGRFSPATPNWYVATGFQKWGMTTSMVAALLLSGLITGSEDPDSAIFDPHRFNVPASAKNLMTDGTQAVKGIAKSVFAGPRAELDALPNGHGGIVEVDGEKAGVYKDEDSKVYVVSPRCPHLGCQLEWNPDEKSWDCPCHGSRFDYRGGLIDNPAQKNLEYHLYP